MAPKEKCDELIDRMYYIGRYDDKEDYNPTMAWERAKQCTLIAADEVIDQNNIWIMQTGKGTNNYWNEVKKEINAL
jgi:hypothetical protein